MLSFLYAVGNSNRKSVIGHNLLSSYVFKVWLCVVLGEGDLESAKLAVVGGFSFFMLLSIGCNDFCGVLGWVFYWFRCLIV